MGLALVGLLVAGGCAGDSAGNSATSAETTGSTGDEAETDDGDGDPGDGDGDETETETETGEDPDKPDRLAVTADWRAKRLSLLDYAAIRAGAGDREAMLWTTIELPDFEPGPLEVELTPDASLAIVSISPGFFASVAGGIAGAGPGTVPEGGVLLIVEVDTGTVLAELDTASYPMGIVLSPDGSEAFTANFGGNGQSGSTMSRIDLTSLSIVEELEVGPGPEQLDLSADGSLGIINTAGDGSIRVFETADPGGSLSPSLATSDDPSWVLLLDDGMDRAVAINSLGEPGYTLIDVAAPGAPAILDERTVSGIAYAAAPGFSPNQVLLPIITGGSLVLQLFDVDTGELVQELEAPVSGFPLGLVFEPEDGLALLPVPGDDVLVVADLINDEVQVLEWQTAPGPTYVSLN